METTLDCGHRVTLPSAGDRLPTDVPARAQVADRWVIGRHHVLIDDAMQAPAHDAALDLGGRDIGAVIVDPPFDARIGRPAWLPDAPAFVFTDNDHLTGVVAAWGAPASVLIWDCVGADVTVSRRPLRQMKLCLFYGDVRRFDWRGDAWDRRIPRPERTTTCQLGEVFRLPIAQLHRAGPRHRKPVDWVRRLIGCLTQGTVFDPFLGSGTSAIAAAQLGRRSVGIERDPAMADLAIARIAAWTGQEPKAWS